MYKEVRSAGTDREKERITDGRFRTIAPQFREHALSRPSIGGKEIAALTESMMPSAWGARTISYTASKLVFATTPD
ncbi:hypothetical protein MRX96_004778 [Rhipicephalus microplus]